jgi:hypothetical protein
MGSEGCASDDATENAGAGGRVDMSMSRMPSWLSVGHKLSMEDSKSWGYSKTEEGVGHGLSSL